MACDEYKDQAAVHSEAKKKGGESVDRLPALREASALNKF